MSNTDLKIIWVMGGCYFNSPRPELWIYVGIGYNGYLFLSKGMPDGSSDQMSVTGIPKNIRLTFVDKKNVLLSIVNK